MFMLTYISSLLAGDSRDDPPIQKNMNTVMRKTKIIATLGPATQKANEIEKLIRLGVNAFRLNFSHGDQAYHGRLIKRIRTIAARLDVPVAILQDIAGPKIRVGEIDGVLHLHEGDVLTILALNADQAKKQILINYPQILSRVKSDDLIYFADGAIQTRVVGVSKQGVKVRVMLGGKLSSRKGVSFPRVDLPINAITDKDREDIVFGVQEEVDIIALSFVRSPADIKEARDLITGHGGDIPVYAKIEKTEAVDNLDAIVSSADGIMVARGDLGVEVGIHRVPVVQKKIIVKAKEAGIPVITATQMLTSMISSPFPTRAEVSDVANAVLDGTDAVMLSDETTVGKYPNEAIMVLDRTIVVTESIYPWYTGCDSKEPHQAIAASATTLSQSVGADAIVAFTESGLAAQMIARQRPQTRIIGTTSNPRTYRRLAICWGVEPFFVGYPHTSSDNAISHFYRKALDEVLLHPDDRFVVTIGMHSNKSGSTNQIQLMDGQCMERLEAARRGEIP